MTVVYANAVHYDNNGQWMEVDNSLQAVGSDSNGIFKNRAGEWSISFPQKIEDGKWISIEKEGYTLKFGLAGEIRKNSQLSSDATADSKNMLSANLDSKIESVTNAVFGTIYTEDVSLLLEDMEYPETYVDNQSSKLQYNEVYTNTDIEYIVETGRINGFSAAVDVLDEKSYQLPATDSYVKLHQSIRDGGEEGNNFVLAFWYRQDESTGFNIEDGEYPSVKLVFTDANSNNQYSKTIPLIPGAENANEWIYVAESLAAPCDYKSITVEFMNKMCDVTTYIDGVQLYQDRLGTVYEYDTKGRVTSSTDALGLKTEYEYDSNNNLFKITPPTGGISLYYYDDYHNLTHEHTGDGINTDYTYNMFGNMLTKTVSTAEATMVTTYTYTGDENQPASICDAQGNTTTYGYSLHTGMLEWVKEPGDTEASKTIYEYDDLYRLEKVQRPSAAGSMYTMYSYNLGQLETLSTPSTTYTFEYGNFGLRNSVKIGEDVLAAYEYTTNNELSALDYGNGDSVSYTYDELGRVVTKVFEDGETYRYTYHESGELATVTKDGTSDIDSYVYDAYGRLIKYSSDKGNSHYKSLYSYQVAPDIVIKKEYEGSTLYNTTQYTYDEYNRIVSVTPDGLGRQYSYDTLGRVTGWSDYNGDQAHIETTITYRNIGTGTNQTTGQIASLSTTGTGYTMAYNYGYDSRGNIISISDGSNTTTYVYDNANQLIRENNQAAGFTWVWSYDSAGNLKSRQKYAYTTGAVTSANALEHVSYGYSDGDWGDLLISYGGRAFAYDEIGNLESDGVWNYTWEHGRQLASMTTATGSATWTYTYDSNGLRTSRTGGNLTYQYIYEGDKLVMLKRGSSVMRFVYDAQGRPMMMDYNGTPYYYILNAQGDVMALSNANGVRVIRYTYDAWGNPLSAIGMLADSVGLYNPLRYRGYVYDQETGLYYLQSRYYNPQVGRFINADAFASTGQGVLGCNMFAYCLNNPVNASDPSGHEPITLFMFAKYALEAFVYSVIILGGLQIISTILEDSTPTLGSIDFTQRKQKPVNLPSPKKLTIDMKHIASGHMPGGSRNPNGNKDVFWGMTAAQVSRAIYEAYSNSSKLQTQDTSVLLEGFSYEFQLKIKIWVDLVEKVIKTAFPVN